MKFIISSVTTLLNLVSATQAYGQQQNQSYLFENQTSSLWTGPIWVDTECYLYKQPDCVDYSGIYFENKITGKLIPSCLMEFAEAFESCYDEADGSDSDSNTNDNDNSDSDESTEEPKV